MSFLIDTNVAIHLRDLNDEAATRLDAVSIRPMLSIITVLELENGVVRQPALWPFRRARVDAILEDLLVLNFGPAELASYRGIVEAVGYSRPRILDRLIAATALVRDLTLITMNGSDFCDIPGLQLEVWPSPTI